MLKLDESDLGRYELILTKDEMDRIAAFSKLPGSEVLFTKAREMTTFFGGVLGEEPELMSGTGDLVFGDKNGARVKLEDGKWVATGFCPGSKGAKQIISSVCVLCWLKAFIHTEPRLIISNSFGTDFDIRWCMTDMESQNVLSVRNWLLLGNEKPCEQTRQMLKTITDAVGVSAAFSWQEVALYFYAPTHKAVRLDLGHQSWYGEALSPKQLVVTIPFLCYLMGKEVVG